MSQVPEQAPTPPPTQSGAWTMQRTAAIIAGGLGGLLAALFVIGLLFALLAEPTVTAARFQIVRDVFMILITLQGILIIIALSVLIVQVARLLNLLKTQAKPVLTNAQEAVNTAKATTQFVSANVTQPIVQASAFMAGARVFLRDAGGIRRAIRRRPNGAKNENGSENSQSG